MLTYISVRQKINDVGELHSKEKLQKKPLCIKGLRVYFMVSRTGLEPVTSTLSR